MSLDIKFCDKNQPTNDFYNFVNGKWIEENPIPSDYQKWSIFNELDENNKIKVKNILNNLEYTDDDDQSINSLKTLYDMGMDVNTINSFDPIVIVEPYILRISNAISKDDLLEQIFQLHTLHGISTPVLFSSYSDFNNSKFNILHLFTGGLGLPDRDYYFEEDKESIRIEYKKFISNFLKLFGLEYNIEKIFNIEKVLAKYTQTKVERRDPNILNNPRKYSQLIKRYKSFPLEKLFKFLNIDNPNIKINVSNPIFLDKHEELWDQLSLDSWKEYYIWKFLTYVSSYINEEVTNIKFNFYGKILSGTPNMLPRWKRVIDNCNFQMGVVIGDLYVKKHFSETAKNKAMDMVKYIMEELKLRLKNNDWMEDSTKVRALEKLEKMGIKIGYPDSLKDYSNLNLSKYSSYLDNNMRCLKFNENFEWDKLYQEKDNNEWFMNPHMVNAYFSPSNNEIVFPAGILQKPFFCETYDIPLNMGGIGTVIGHEITHGFDDQGRKFDADGNLNDWWNSNDARKYKEKTKNLKNQFASYIIEGKNINGDLTLGENIADLGGVSISYHSMMKYIEDNKNKNITLEGFTPQQRFFLNYAKIWRCNIRPEETINRIMVDPHSPPIFRVNGVVTNLTEFYNAFNLKENDNLWKPPNTRISIW